MFRNSQLVKFRKRYKTSPGIVVAASASWLGVVSPNGIAQKFCCRKVAFNFRMRVLDTCRRILTVLRPRLCFEVQPL